MAMVVGEVMTSLEQDVAELKARIQFSVREATTAFRLKQGIMPSAIVVTMEETTAHVDRLRSYVVGDVRVEFNL